MKVRDVFEKFRYLNRWVTCIAYHATVIIPPQAAYEHVNGLSLRAGGDNG
ncbi:MAG: hypothetical protein QGH66_09045 [Dehalococcoidia bacterium]|nr:hypothetical protein [Dehalococcoidia bacterium]